MGMSILEESFKLVMGDKGVGNIDMGSGDVTSVEFAESYANAQAVTNASDMLLLESLIVLGQEMEEGLGDKIASGWESIKAFIIKVFKFIVKGAMKVVDFFKKLFGRLNSTQYKGVFNSAKDALKKMEKSKAPKNVDKKVKYKKLDAKKIVDLFGLELADQGNELKTMEKPLSTILSGASTDVTTSWNNIVAIMPESDNLQKTEMKDIFGMSGTKGSLFAGVKEISGEVVDINDEVKDKFSDFIDELLDLDEEEGNVIEVKGIIQTRLSAYVNATAIKNNRISKEVAKITKGLNKTITNLNKFITKLEKMKEDINDVGILDKFNTSIDVNDSTEGHPKAYGVIKEHMILVQKAISQGLSVFLTITNQYYGLLEKASVMIKKDITVGLSLI